MIGKHLTFNYQYDTLSRLIVSSVTLAGLSIVGSSSQSVTLNYRYNNSMRLAKTTTTIGDDDDFENVYSYNTFNELVGISQTILNPLTTISATKNIGYEYNQESQRISTSRYEGSTFIADTTYNYDGIGRLTQIEHQGLSETFANYSMTHDAASRITSINDANYSYDSTDQLIDAEYDNQADETYEYDETGNRTNYEIGANNQILSDGVYNYTYDAEGNRISKTNIDPNITDTTIYAWDHRNRLISVTITTDTNTIAVNYRYDYLNRLISRTVEQTDNQTETTQTTTQHFIHDDNQIILEFLDNELSQRNFWGAEIDELLSVDNLIDDETLWVLADHLNSTRKILKSDNDQVSTIATIEYDAFGNIVSGTNPITIAYTGKYHDEITQLQWNINRWYDSNTGQWISEDPIGFNAGDVNLRRYAGNSPINNVDPDGLDWWNDSWRDNLYPWSWGAWAGNGIGIAWSNVTNCTNAIDRFNDQRTREINNISNGNGDASKALNTEIPTEVTETLQTLAEVGVIFNSTAAGLAATSATASTSSAATTAGRTGSTKSLAGSGKIVVKSWDETAKTVDAILRPQIDKLKQIYPNAKFGYRGSLATGKKYSTGSKFNPNDWDVDAFIVSDELAAMFSKAETRFRDGRKISAEVKNISTDLQTSLKNISGYRIERQNKKEFTFRIYTEAEFDKIVKPNGYKLF
jgi:RHS repeat-associated protein